MGNEEIAILAFIGVDVVIAFAGEADIRAGASDAVAEHWYALRAGFFAVEEVGLNAVCAFLFGVASGAAFHGWLAGKAHERGIIDIVTVG